MKGLEHILHSRGARGRSQGGARPPGDNRRPPSQSRDRDPRDRPSSRPSSNYGPPSDSEPPRYGRDADRPSRPQERDSYDSPSLPRERDYEPPSGPQGRDYEPPSRSRHDRDPPRYDRDHDLPVYDRNERPRRPPSEPRYDHQGPGNDRHSRHRGKILITHWSNKSDCTP